MNLKNIVGVSDKRILSIDPSSAQPSVALVILAF